MLAFLRAQMQNLLTQRAALKTELDATIEAPTKEKRDLTDAEQSAFTEKRDALKAKDDEIDALKTRITELEDAEKRDATAAELRAQFGQSGPQPSGLQVTA
jgi:polyhydroxyalkanoate synthesis regulator phasin